MNKKLHSLAVIAFIAFMVLSARNAVGQIVFTSVPDSVAVVNQPYTYDVESAWAPNAPTYSLQTAPAGMTINSSTGVISWTPASMSVGGPVMVKAQNNSGSFYQTFNIYITDAVACDPDIISYWPMDASFPVAGGFKVLEGVNGYDAFWNNFNSLNPATISTDGMVGNSIKFEPSDNESAGLTVADVNQYEFKGAVQFSVSFWFKNQPNTIDPYHPEIFIGRYMGLAAAHSNWYIRWNPYTEHIEFNMRDHAPNDTTVISSNVILDNDFNWHHVVATFYAQTDPETNSFLNLFVDGVQTQVQYDFWTDDFDGTGDLTMGSLSNDWAVEPYSGLLDEVTIWDRELLPADVNALRSKGLSHIPVCQEGNTAPIITTAALTSATEDAAYSYQLKYREIDGDVITKSAPVLPSWLSFNTSTGVLSGTPTNDNIGNHNVTLRISDGSVNIDQTFVINVANVNDIPVITSSAATAVNEDAAYSYTVTATDADAGATLTYSAPVLPAWLSFNASTHILSGTPTNAQVGHNASANFDVTIRVTDNASASVDQSFVITVNQVNDAPVINSQNALTTSEDQSLIIPASAINVTDVDDTYPDDFTFTVKSGNNYTFTGNQITPNENWNGTLTVPIEINDGSATVSYDLSVSVTAVNDDPAFTSEPIESIVVGELYQYWIYTSDAEGSPLTMTCISKPSWLTFSQNNGSGILQGTPAKADVGTTEIKLRVNDGTTDIDQTFNLEVIIDNYTPEFTSTPDLDVKVDSLYTYTITATDGDNDDLTITVPTLPSWLTYNSSTKVLSGIPAAAAVGDHNVVIEVTDGKETAEQTFTITVSNLDAIGKIEMKYAKVYPVPAREFVTFEFAGKLNDAVLHVYNLSGALVKQADVSNLSYYKLDLLDFKADYYIYRITTANGIQSGSIVVE